MPRHRAIKTKRAAKSRTPEKSEQDNADSGEGNSALAADAGYREIPVQHPSIDVYELACKMGNSDRSVLHTVMDRSEGSAADINTKFGTNEADLVRAVSILKALGISEEMQPKICSEFSAHWRVQIALARVLYMHQSPLVFGDHLDLDERTRLVKELEADDKMKNKAEEEPPFADNLTVCCICQNTLQTTRLPTCSHEMHLSCARTCFKDNNWRDCPLCKSNIPLEQLRTYGVDSSRESTSLNRVPTPFPFDNSDESDGAPTSPTFLINSPDSSSSATAMDQSLQFLYLSRPRWSEQRSLPIAWPSPELSPTRYPSPCTPHRPPPRWSCSPSKRNPPPPNSLLISPQRVSSISRRLPLESSSARTSPFLLGADPSFSTGTIPSSRRSDSISRSLPLESSLARTSPLLPGADPSCPTGTIPSSRKSDSISRSLPLESSSARTSPFLPRADPSCPTGTIPLSRGSDPETLVNSRSVPRLSPLRPMRLQWLSGDWNLCSRSMLQSWNSSPPRRRQSRQRSSSPPQRNSRSPLSPGSSSSSPERKQTPSPDHETGSDL